MRVAEWRAGGGGGGTQRISTCGDETIPPPPVNQQQVTKECKCAAETSISIYMHFRRTKLFLFSHSAWFV
jgi:hypothetical protein